MADRDQLVLDGDPSGVRAARRLARTRAPALGADLDDLELLVAELVTNATLHGVPPITLRLRPLDQVVRVEVGDGGREMPMAEIPGAGTMTGRGLPLVQALSTSWGVDRRPDGGKVVWAELPAQPMARGRGVRPSVAVDDPPSTGHATPPGSGPSSPASGPSPPASGPSPPASGPSPPASGPASPASGPSPPPVSEPPSEPLFTVRLGAVPTQLLVEAKAQIDSVVREFTLARADGTWLGSSISGAVDELVDTVTTGFAPARAEIKRQALVAARRGDVLTDLVLRLPASAADAAEAYLAALDETDRLARSEQLLTLATPPVHRVFRRWYLGAVISQLRTQVDGDATPPSSPFVDALADEVTELSSLRDAWNLLQLLEKVTGELTAAHTVEQIGRTVVQNAADFLGALVVRIHLLGDDGILRMIAGHGGVADLRERYSEFPIDADLPASVVVRKGESMLLRNRAEIEARFPPLVGTYPVERILHIVPLRVGDRALGCLTLTFSEGSHLEEGGQISFVEALAQTLAQALDRAVILQRLEDANRQLAFLADASAALTSSLDYSATVAAVARVMVPRLADWCIVEVVQDDQLRPVAVRHVDPAKQAWGTRMAERFPTRMNASVGSANVLRTGRSELHLEMTEEQVRELAANDDHLAALARLGMRSGLIVPLGGRGGTLGTITLLYAESGRRYEPTDVPLVEDVARRAARALETAGAVREQSIRLATVTSIAEAAQHAILAPPPRVLGPVSLSARYLSAAAEAQVGGDLYEVVARPGAVRLLIGDVRGKGLAAVRTATVVLGEFRAAAADLDDLAAVAAQLDRRLRPYLDPEDFVTALLAQIDDSGQLALASCGHPPPLLASKGQIIEVAGLAGVPLGLGAAPSTVTRQLVPGDRLLLYTDGIVEARDERNVFIDFMKLAETVAHGPFDLALDQLLNGLDEAVGANLGDDLALVLAEYHGSGEPER